MVALRSGSVMDLRLTRVPTIIKDESSPMNLALPPQKNISSVPTPEDEPLLLLV